MAMTDSDFVTAFEACALSNEDFHHRDHVRLAWLYLKDLPPEEALARFATGLRRFAHAHGKPGLYHRRSTLAGHRDRRELRDLLLRRCAAAAAASRCASL